MSSYTNDIRKMLDEIDKRVIYTETANKLSKVASELQDIVLNNKPTTQYFDVRLQCAFLTHSKEEAVVRFIEWMKKMKRPEDYTYIVSADIGDSTSWKAVWGVDAYKG